jgi:hypothetical protein
VTTRHQPRQSRSGQHRPVCPTCGWAPHSGSETERLREELQTVWWSVTTTPPGQVIQTRHCGRCQPHNVYVVACLVCGDGPILAGPLADATRDADPQQLPTIVVDQLATAGWRRGTGALTLGWVCCR